MILILPSGLTLAAIILKSNVFPWIAKLSHRNFYVVPTYVRDN